MALTYQEVVLILKILQDSSCTEFEFSQGDLHFTFRRDHRSLSTASTPLPDAPSPAPDHEPPQPVSGTPQSTTASDAPSHWVSVTAPMVGCFYRQPAPDQPPFVEEGQSVRAGDPVGIIEVMKLMNTISAECHGIVRRIMVPNESLVEYGQVLMYIEPLPSEGDKAHD